MALPTASALVLAPASPQPPVSTLLPPDASTASTGTALPAHEAASLSPGSSANAGCCVRDAHRDRSASDAPADQPSWRRTAPLAATAATAVAAVESADEKALSERWIARLPMEVRQSAAFALATAPPGHVADMLAALLMQLLSNNDTLPVRLLTLFHARTPPPISVAHYLQRFVRYAPFGNECFILLLVYLDRIVQHTGLVISSLSIHRLIVTGLLLATKFSQDRYYTNGHFARVGGLPLSELNALELEFLHCVGFRLFATVGTLEEYYRCLMAHCTRNGLFSRLPTRPGSGVVAVAASPIRAAASALPVAARAPSTAVMSSSHGTAAAPGRGAGTAEHGADAGVLVRRMKRSHSATSATDEAPSLPASRTGGDAVKALHVVATDGGRRSDGSVGHRGKHASSSSSSSNSSSSSSGESDADGDSDNGHDGPDDGQPCAPVPLRRA